MEQNDDTCCEICSADDHLGNDCPFNQSDDEQLYEMIGGELNWENVNRLYGYKIEDLWKEFRVNIHEYKWGDNKSKEFKKSLNEIKDLLTNENIKNIFKYLHDKIGMTSDSTNNVEKFRTNAYKLKKILDSYLVYVNKTPFKVNDTTEVIENLYYWNKTEDQPGKPNQGLDIKKDDIVAIYKEHGILGGYGKVVREADIQEDSDSLKVIVDIKGYKFEEPFEEDIHSLLEGTLYKIHSYYLVPKKTYSAKDFATYLDNNSHTLNEMLKKQITKKGFIITEDYQLLEVTLTTCWDSKDFIANNDDENYNFQKIIIDDHADHQASDLEQLSRQVDQTGSESSSESEDTRSLTTALPKEFYIQLTNNGIHTGPDSNTYKYKYVCFASDEKYGELLNAYKTIIKELISKFQKETRQQMETGQQTETEQQPDQQTNESTTQNNEELVKMYDLYEKLKCRNIDKIEEYFPIINEIQGKLNDNMTIIQQKIQNDLKLTIKEACAEMGVEGKISKPYFFNDMKDKFNNKLESLEEKQKSKEDATELGYIFFSAIKERTTDKGKKARNVLKEGFVTDPNNPDSVTINFIKIKNNLEKFDELITDREAGRGSYTDKITIFTQTLLGYFFTSGWGGSSPHTIASTLAPEEQLLQGPAAAIYSSWSRFNKGRNWTLELNQLNPLRDELSPFVLNTMKIKKTSPIFDELRIREKERYTKNNWEFVQDVIGMTVAVGAAFGIGFVPGIGLLTNIMTFNSTEKGLKTIGHGMLFNAILKIFSGFVGYGSTLINRIENRDILGYEEGKLNTTRFKRFLTGIGRKFVDISNLWKKYRKSLEIAAANKRGLKEKRHNKYFDQMSMYENLQNLINTGSNKQLKKLFNHEINMIYLARNQFNRIDSEELNNLKNNIYDSILSYNNELDLRSVFKEDYFSVIFDSIIFKKNLENTDINEFESAKKPGEKTEESGKLLDKLFCINIKKTYNISGINDIKNCNNNLLKKLFVCVYTDVKKYFVDNYFKKFTMHSDITEFNKTLKYLFNEYITNLSINSTIKIYNFYIAEVIYTIVRDNRISSGQNNIISISKLKKFIDLFVKYVSIKLIQSYPSTHLGNLIKKLYNCQNNSMKKKIINYLKSNTKHTFQIPTIENEIYSNVCLIGSEVYNGESYDTSSHLGKWFDECSDNNENKQLGNNVCHPLKKNSRFYDIKDIDNIQSLVLTKDFQDFSGKGFKQDSLKKFLENNRYLHDWYSKNLQYSTKNQSYIVEVKEAEEAEEAEEVKEAEEAENNSIKIYKLIDCNTKKYTPILSIKIDSLKKIFVDIREPKSEIFSDISRVQLENRVSVYKKADVLLEMTNILRKFRYNNTFNLEKTQFLTKLFNYLTKFKKYKEEDGKFTSNDKVKNRGIYEFKDFFYKNLVTKCSATDEEICIYHFRYNMFNCMSDLLVKIDYKIPVALFSPEPNYKDISEQARKQGNQGYFSRTPYYTDLFGENFCKENDANCNLYSHIDFTPGKSIDKQASVGEFAVLEGEKKIVHTLYYHYNDIYKAVCDTFNVFNISISNSSSYTSVQKFKLNLNYIEDFIYDFDYDTLKYDNYTTISNKSISTTNNTLVKNIINQKEDYIRQLKTDTEPAGQLTERYFKHKSLVELEDSQDNKQIFVSSNFKTGVYGNGVQLVNKNILPSINPTNTNFKLNLDDNIWFYYDINKDKVCLRFKGDITEDYKDTLHLCDDKTLSHKITNEKIEKFINKLLESKFTQLREFEVFSSGNKLSISLELKNVNQLTDIYMNYFSKRQLDMEYSLQKNQFFKNYSFNRVKLIDLDIDKKNIIDNIKTNVDQLVFRYLSIDDVLNLEWELSYNKHSDTSSFNDWEITCSYDIIPVFNIKKHPISSIIQLSRSIDTINPENPFDASGLKKLLSKLLKFNTHINKGYEWQKILITSLIKFPGCPEKNDNKETIQEVIKCLEQTKQNLDLNYWRSYLDNVDKKLSQSIEKFKRILRKSLYCAPEFLKDYELTDIRGWAKRIPGQRFWPPLRYKVYLVPYIDDIKINQSDTDQNRINVEHEIYIVYYKKPNFEKLIENLEKLEQINNIILTKRKSITTDAYAKKLINNKKKIINQIINNPDPELKPVYKYREERFSFLHNAPKLYLRNFSSDKSKNLFEHEIDDNDYIKLMNMQHNLDYKSTEQNQTKIEDFITKMSPDHRADTSSIYKKINISCGITSTLGNICERIYDYYINGCLDNIPIRSFIQTDGTQEEKNSEELFIKKYINSFKTLRTKRFENPTNKVGLEISGHSIGGSYAVGLMYILYYKLMDYSFSDTKKFNELLEIVKNSNVFSFGSSRHFDSYATIFENFMQKLLTIHEPNNQKHKYKITNVINIGASLPLLTWNNVHIGKTIYIEHNIWNNLGYKVFNIKKDIIESEKDDKKCPTSSDESTENSASNVCKKKYCNFLEDNDNSPSYVFNWKEGMQYKKLDNYCAIREIHRFHEKYEFEYDNTKLRKNISNLNNEFILNSKEPFKTIYKNHIAVNPSVVADNELLNELKIVDNPLGLITYELDLVNSNIGYLTYNNNNTLQKVSIRNKTLESIYSWSEKKVGLEFHQINRNWVRIRKMEQQKTEVDEIVNFASSISSQTRPRKKYADKPIIFTYNKQNTEYGEDQSIVPWMLNMPHHYIKNIQCADYKSEYEFALKNSINKENKTSYKTLSKTLTFKNIGTLHDLLNIKDKLELISFKSSTGDLAYKLTYYNFLLRIPNYRTFRGSIKIDNPVCSSGKTCIDELLNYIIEINKISKNSHSSLEDIKNELLNSIFNRIITSKSELTLENTAAPAPEPATAPATAPPPEPAPEPELEPEPAPAAASTSEDYKFVTEYVGSKSNKYKQISEIIKFLYFWYPETEPDNHKNLNHFKLITFKLLKCIFSNFPEKPLAGDTSSARTSADTSSQKLPQSIKIHNFIIESIEETYKESKLNLTQFSENCIYIHKELFEELKDLTLIDSSNEFFEKSYYKIDNLLLMSLKNIFSEDVDSVEEKTDLVKYNSDPSLIKLKSVINYFNIIENIKNEQEEQEQQVEEEQEQQVEEEQKQQVEEEQKEEETDKITYSRIQSYLSKKWKNFSLGEPSTEHDLYNKERNELNKKLRVDWHKYRYNQWRNQDIELTIFERKQNFNKLKVKLILTSINQSSAVTREQPNLSRRILKIRYEKDIQIIFLDEIFIKKFSDQRGIVSHSKLVFIYKNEHYYINFNGDEIIPLNLIFENRRARFKKYLIAEAARAELLTESEPEDETKE